MDLFVIIELAFIIIYSFAILKNYFKRNALKKEGPFVVLKNYNLSSIIYIIILAVIAFIYMMCVDQSSMIEKVLSFIIILLLILNIFINSKLLLTHGSLYYMYYNVPYKSINLVKYKEKSKESYLIKLEFEKTVFNFSMKKASFDDFYEVLKYKKVKVEKA